MNNLEIVDCHHHLWDLTAGYPWLQDPVNPDRFTGDDTAIRRNYLPADFLDDVGGLKLLASVHVDAGASDPLAEARWLQGQHDDTGLPNVAVASADLSRSDAGSLLEALAEVSITRGVRHILNWHDDPNYTYTSRNDLMTDRVWLENFGRLEHLGLSFDLQVYPHQLEQAAALAGAHPGTTIVLNHAGMPTSSDPDHVALWRRGIAALAAQPNTVAKISGLGMTDHHWTADSLRPFVEGIIEAFGTRRSAFASNFPVDSLYSSYGELFAAFDTIVADLTPSERRSLFVDTAVRTYAIPMAEISTR